MPDPDKVAIVVAEWVAKAENDLKTAAIILRSGKDWPTDAVCFHSQRRSQLYSGGKMRTTLLTVCAFTLLACCWLTTMESVLRHPGYPSRMIMDLLLAAASLITGLVALFLAATVWRWLALAAALGAGGVGVSALIHDARAAHFEGFVLVIGTALCLQGALAIWVLGLGPRTDRV